MWWYNDGGVHWGWMVFGAVWMVLFWTGVALSIVWLARGALRSSGRPPVITPMGIARERFAKGEITEEEYEDIKRTLA